MKHLCQLVVRNTGAWKGQDWHIYPMFERGSNMTKIKFHYAHRDISHYTYKLLLFYVTVHIIFVYSREYQGLNLTVTVKNLLGTVILIVKTLSRSNL